MKHLAIAAVLFVAFSVSPSLAGGGGRDARGTGYGAGYGQGYRLDPQMRPASQQQMQPGQSKIKRTKKLPE